MTRKIKNYLGQFSQAPRSTVIGISLVLLTWLVAALMVAGLVIWSGERSGQAQIDPEGTELPVILLEPASGAAGSFVTIWGEDWPADDTVLVYLLAEDQNQIPDYAVANAVTDEDGRFVTGVTLPSGPLWDDQETITIIARVDRSGPVAQAAFRIEGEPAPLEDAPTVTGDQTDTPTPEPSDTPTDTVEPTLVLTVPIPTASPAATATTPPRAAAQPSLTSIANLNVRTGPGLDYPIVGLLSVGQSAAVTGVSGNGLWWQIYFPSSETGRAWVSAYYVKVWNTGDVQVVEAPPPPAPAPAPPAQTWRGEYYANPILSFDPALVRNDPAIDFNWGVGAPASQLPAERFSVRWTRRQTFDEGLYRFYAWVDDGVRLYVDDTLVIDEWRDGAARQVSGDRWLSAGTHNLKVEYYDNSYESVIRVWWERVDGTTPTYPDWKGEYWPNRNLSGSPVIVRNDRAPDFNWGTGSPGAGLPADNFSARWTSDLYLTEGRYRFHLVADDGVRLWVDGHLFVDKWWDGRHEEWAEAWLGSGSHHVRLEYYEHTGEAYLHLWADRILDSGGGDDDEPEADFDVDRRSGIAPLEVEFDNDSEGDYDECKWYFGDGDTSRDCDDPEHTYREAGTYTVKLKVWNDDDDDEDSKEREDYITVYAPVEADFSASPRTGELPLTVSFTNRSAGDYNQCLWSFGDGAISNDCRPGDHEYVTAGTYDVHLAVGGSGGRDVESKFSYVVVTAGPPAELGPIAVISGPTLGLVRDSLTFDGSSSSDPDGTIASYSWVLGDGTTGSGATVSHSYDDPGSYEVVLTVADNDGLTDTSRYTVIIEETAGTGFPVAAINGPATALVGETVIFDSDGSYDPDGDIVDYIWDFDADEVPMLTQAAESTVAHVYDSPGAYRVTLTVVDDEGQRDTASRTITVEETSTNAPPVAVINGPTTALAGETVTFDSEGSEDPDGDIVSYRWDFGDRNPADMVSLAQSGESTVAHVYSAAGNYQVTLTVVDDDGARAEATQMIAVEGAAPNQPPQAVINGPTSGTVGELLTFDGGSSSDPDGTVNSYAWDFGDGNTATGANVSHSYGAALTYTVTLSITDNEGLSDSSSYTLPIDEPSSTSLSDQSTDGTATPKPSPTPSATSTDTPEPSPTPSTTPTPTSEASPTATTEPSRQPARSPSSDSEQSATSSEPATSTPTSTATPTDTETREPATSTDQTETTTEETATATAEPTSTPVPSPTPTPRPPTATATPTPRPPTPTPTPVPPTSTPRPPTATPTPRPPTATPTPRPPTATATAVPATATPLPPPPTSEPAAPPPVASPSITPTVEQAADTSP